MKISLLKIGPVKKFFETKLGMGKNIAYTSGVAAST